MISYAHAKSASVGAPRARGARVRGRRRVIHRGGDDVRDQSAESPALDGAPATHRRQRREGQGRRPAVARPLGPATRDHGRGSRRHDRRIDAGVQPGGGPVGASPSIQHSAGAAPRRIRVQKKRPRPLEQDRPLVRGQRAEFAAWAATVDPTRLVFVDESGANLAMGRSHAWVPRGEERIAPRPMNWGTTLTMIGAVRRTGWVTMRTLWQTANSDRFIAWVREHLAPHLRRDDIVVMDNLWAHRHRDVRALIEQRGATVQFLPPYSPDF